MKESGDDKDAALSSADSPEYIPAKISSEYDGKFAGKEIQVLANDYTSKGDEELIEVKIGDDIIFVEKKYIIVEPSNVISKEVEKPEKVQVEIEGDNDKVVVKEEDELVDLENDPVEPKEKEEEPVQKSEEPDVELEEPKAEPETISVSDLDKETEPISIADNEPETSPQEDLQGKLKKTLDDLKDIQKDMKNTFTSTETISATITSIKGMIDALRKDQLEMQESMKTDQTLKLDPKKNIEKFTEAQQAMISMGQGIIDKTNAPSEMLKEIKERVEISQEWLKRAENLLKENDIQIALKEEYTRTYPNKTEIDKFTNKVWFDSLKFWTSLVEKQN